MDAAQATSAGGSKYAHPCLAKQKRSMLTMDVLNYRVYTEDDVGCSDQERFVMELEFIQCLANPFYLNYLAQNKYLEDPAFLSYLKYLGYWRKPEYAQYIQFPHCLAMLDMLQSEQFRKAIAVHTIADQIHQQQFFYWQHYLSNRAKAQGQEQGVDAPSAVATEQSSAAVPAS